MAPKLEMILARLDLGALTHLFAAQHIDDSLLASLTDDDLQKIGIDKLGHRKALLAAFASQTSQASSQPFTGGAEPALATRERPFVNSLGLPFVPTASHAPLFCIWPFRVRDYQLYCQENAMEFPRSDFTQGPDHPVVNVTWNDASAVCQWLTERERRLGIINHAFLYRLPQDREWSTAVQLDHESGGTPAERSGRKRGYPWGAEFPPPRGAGNYHSSLRADDFPETSPVGSFAANALGIYDLGGNVWEWCLDKYDRESDRRVLRGASCFNDDHEYLLSSYRDKAAPNSRRNNNGLRLVLSEVHERDPWR